MGIFTPPPKPTSPLAFHRVLSPTASIKVSPLCLGGISIGSSWSSLFGKNEDPYALLDAFYRLGGNFIDTSNTYCSEDSERLIGSWMTERGLRDQMVIATKYSAGYKAYDRESIKLQSNYTGNSAKSMYISVRDSLQKLQTEYIDILYVHWWDFCTSVEEVMRHLHALVMQRKVLYLGISDTPAWVVVKANAFARQHGLTPFSVYQGKWNVAYRDLEGDIIPMCEDEGLAVVPWAALGGGNLLSAEQREAAAADPQGARPSYDGGLARTKEVEQVVREIAKEKRTTFQAVLLAYLFQQSTYVFPIVGVQTVAHVEAMKDALVIRLTEEELGRLRAASPFRPQFPMDFLFGHRRDVEKEWDVRKVSVGENSMVQMAAWIDGPRKEVTFQGLQEPAA